MHVMILPFPAVNLEMMSLTNILELLRSSDKFRKMMMKTSSNSSRQVSRKSLARSESTIMFVLSLVLSPRSLESKILLKGLIINGTDTCLVRNLSLPGKRSERGVYQNSVLRNDEPLRDYDKREQTTVFECV